MNEWQQIEAGVWARAVEFLRTTLQPVREQIQAAMVEDPNGWWMGYHFGWGMAVRNILRQNGYGEKELLVWNLDDVYIQLVEEAIRQT